MVKSFDVISEAKAMNYQFLKAQLVISNARNPPAPPPFFALTVPWEICFKRSDRAGMQQPARLLAMHKAPMSKERELEALLAAKERELEDANFIANYIEENDSDSAQQERWRIDIRRVATLALSEVKKVHRQLEEYHEKLSDMQPDEDDLNGQVRKVKKAKQKPMI